MEALDTGDDCLKNFYWFAVIKVSYSRGCDVQHGESSQ